MRSLIGKSCLFILIRYMIYWAYSYYDSGGSMKLIRGNDIKNATDLFYAFWLIGIPVLLDFLLLAIPLSLIINFFKDKSKIILFILIISLFIVDYYLSSSIYGKQYAGVKLALNVLVFPFIFWKLFLFTFISKNENSR